MLKLVALRWGKFKQVVTVQFSLERARLAIVRFEFDNIIHHEVPPSVEPTDTR